MCLRIFLVLWGKSTKDERSAQGDISKLGSTREVMRVSDRQSGRFRTIYIRQTKGLTKHELIPIRYWQNRRQSRMGPYLLPYADPVMFLASGNILVARGPVPARSMIE